MPVPRPESPKSLRQQLQELANTNTIQTARRGFAVIDRSALTAKKELRKIGIDGCDELVDKYTRMLKRKAVELMTGRPQ